MPKYTEQASLAFAPQPPPPRHITLKHIDWIGLGDKPLVSMWLEKKSFREKVLCLTEHDEHHNLDLASLIFLSL